MKNTGIVRRIDDMGRIVIPIELRKILMIEKSDPLEIFTEDDIIVIRNIKLKCYICGENNRDFKVLKDIKICNNCLAEAKAL